MEKTRQHSSLDSMERLQELEERRERLKQGGGDRAIERQHKSGKLTARERIDKFLDPGTFKELNLWAEPAKTGFDVDEKEAPGDAVVMGYGKVNGRVIYVYAHDFTSLGGTQAATQNWKVSRAIDLAVRMGVPYVGLVDSGGVRLQDAFGISSGRGVSIGCDVWYSPAVASGVVPGITLLMGASYAGSAYSPMLADLFFMVKDESFMSLASPELLKAVTFEEVTREEIGAATLHAEVSGSCDYLAANDEDCLKKCRELLSFLPSNCKEKPPFDLAGDDADCDGDKLLAMVSDNSDKSYDMHAVISLLVDSGRFLELKREYAQNMITGLARIGGWSVGIVANNPIHLEGAIDIAAAEKEARFVRFCDAYNIPLIFLVDTKGYVSDDKEEKRGLLRHAAMPVFAICEATVPKITIYIGKCYGESSMAMCTRQMGGDLVLAWPGARLGPVEPEKAVDSIYGKEINTAKQPEELRKKRLKELMDSGYPSPCHAASIALTVDDIIDPRDTRSMLISALEMAVNKAEKKRPWKKRGNIPL